MLHKILHELKVLYARHAPQLKPRKTSTGKSSSSSSSSSVPASSSSSSNSSSEQLSSEHILLPDNHTMMSVSSGCNGGSDTALSVAAAAAASSSTISAGTSCLVSTTLGDAVDPVTDMFNILEGSALVPFAEVGCLHLLLVGNMFRLLRYSAHP